MRIVGLVILGLGVGCVGGMVGIGGGVLLIPALTELFGVDQRRAAGMTLAAMVPPVTLPGVWQYYRQGHLSTVDLGFAACIAVSFACGIFFGAYVQSHVDLSLLRLGFGLLMLYVAVRLIVSSDHEAVNATAGLLAVAVAWIGFLWLRSLGRRHLPRPDLAEQIRRKAEEPTGDNQYYI